MAYPHYDELELPLLKLLFEQGGSQHEMHATQTYLPLAKYFNLDENEVTRSRDVVHGDGRVDPFWNNMVQWARRRLSENGYLAESARGYWRLSETGIEKAKMLTSGRIFHAVYPDEVVQVTTEGAKRTVTVNSYERSTSARQTCIDHYGYKCAVCRFDFEKIYGERGRNFIHVHHIIPLSNIGQSYIVDPIKDLRPICPNCHAMLHRTDPPCSIEDLIDMLN